MITSSDALRHREVHINLPLVTPDSRQLEPFAERSNLIMYQKSGVTNGVLYFAVKQPIRVSRPKSFWQRLCCCKRTKKE